MSVFDSLKTFQRWCAAVCSDYEQLLHHYLTADGLDFQVFRVGLEKFGTTLIHQCAVGKGKSATEQFHRITRVLIQIAKDFWLCHPMTELLENIEDDEFVARPVSPSRLKLMIGGFYLTFAMLETIPTQANNALNKFRLFVDSQDLVALHYFRKCLVESHIPEFVKTQIQYMLCTLCFKDAFELCSESQLTGINPNIRSLRNIVDSNLSKMNYETKDLQNSCIHPSRVNKILKELEKLNTLKVEITTSASKGYFATREALAAQHASKTRGSKISTAIVPMSDSSHKGASTTADSPRYVGLGETLSDIVNATLLSTLLVDTPVLSVRNILANPIADRAMMSECRKRAERTARNSTAETVGVGAPAEVETEEGVVETEPRRNKAYVEEGGIFGRKIINEDKPRVGKRSDRTEPADSSRNLWDYVNTGHFGGGRLAPEEEHSANHGSDGEVLDTAEVQPQASTSAAEPSKIQKRKRKRKTKAE